MANVKYYGKSLISGYDRFDNYSISKMDDSTITLKYDVRKGGPFKPAESPWRIKITYKDAETYKVADGDDAGQDRFTDGKITKIALYNKDSDKLLEIKDLSASLAHFDRAYDEGTLDSYYQHLVSGDSKFESSGYIITGSGKDKVFANSGDAYILDAGGKDQYAGGSGVDTISYMGWYEDPAGLTGGIKADLRDGEIIGPDGHKDKVKGIEAVWGTFMKDEFRGSDGSDDFRGLQGEDKFYGRGGFDIVRYLSDADQGGTDGIVADLKEGKVRDGFGNTDKLYSIEGVGGTNQDDDISDDGNDNYLAGRGGDDVIRVHKGDDRIWGHEGDDRFVFYGDEFGRNTIFGFNRSDDLMEIRQAKDFDDLRIRNNDDGNAVVRFEDGRITLNGIDADDINQSDFIF